MTSLSADRPGSSLLRLVALALVAAGLPGAAFAATGRDITFGYTWRDSADGATRETATYDGTFTSTNPINNSAPQGPINMGFANPWPYYGQTYTTMFISDNGWMSFAAPANSYPTPPTAIPSNALPNGGLLAPFWSDLTADTVIDGDAVRYGRISSIDAFMVQFVGKDASNGSQLVWWDVILYSDGRIKFQYTSPGTVLGNAAIGIENAAGNDGIQIAAGGTAQPGVAFGTNYVVEFSPPLVLPSQCASIPDRGCTSFNGSLPGPGPAYAFYYGCSTLRMEGREAVQSFTLTEPSAVTITLTSARAMTVFLLDDCDERACVRGPSTNISVALGAGTYYVVVDCPVRGDEGNYTLNVACTPLGSPPLACGDPATGTTAGGTSLWATHGCTGTTDYGGTEATEVVTIAAATNLFVTLTAGGATQDVFILDAAGPGEIGPSRCIAAGDTTAVAWDIQPGTYVIVVDGAPGSAGAFDLTTECRIQADCSSPEGVIDTAIARTNIIQGDTTGGTDSIQTYGCDPSINFNGPEHVFEVVLTEPGLLGVYAYNLAPGLSVQFLDSCNEGSCAGTAGAAGCSQLLDAGTHYLVIDGEAGAAGAYEILVTFENPFNRWSACEDPFGSTSIDDTTRNFWNLTDYGFCWDQPNSRNYPDGCVFAMYLTANCGTALHLPFFDVEGGHVRVFDLFAGEYVELTALSQGGWFSQGDEIIWQDTDCENGSDSRWNEVVTDVYFERPEGLCGVYRLEFINHSGNVWELYANCLGDRNPLFNIHDSLCAALEDYSPLPNVSLVSANASFNCPDITVTYTIKNDGCTGVTNFPVDLYDGPTLIDTDFVAALGPGETATFSFTSTFPTTPTSSVRLQADAGGLVDECTEVPGSGCDAVAGTDSIALPGCSGSCQVIANVTATPAQTCAGQPVTIDGSSSSASLCPNGVLEYQLRGPLGTIPWQSSPTFPGLLPTTTGDYDLDVRCRDLPACLDSDRVNVPVERPPQFDAASVVATDNAACNLGVVVNWTAATFFGVTRSGVYNVYRADSDVDGNGVVNCDDAIAAGPVTVGLTALSYADTATVAGGTYYYVIEAEDGQPNTRCVPAGPRNGGAATRVAANRGTCVAIVDDSSVRPDLLPRIGGTLRGGGDYGDGTRRYGETFVEFTWQVDRPLDAARGEHYHVYRSAAPDTGFTRLTNDVTRLQFETYTDFAADHPNDGRTYCWYYVAYVADSCDNENSAFDGGDD